MPEPRGSCDALFLDFSKAFDKVPHLLLFNKLQFYGIHGPLLHWIKHFLISQSQEVIIENEHSHPCNVLLGVPQGTVLAPVLLHQARAGTAHAWFLEITFTERVHVYACVCVCVCVCVCLRGHKKIVA